MLSCFRVFRRPEDQDPYLLPVPYAICRGTGCTGTRTVSGIPDQGSRYQTINCIKRCSGAALPVPGTGNDLSLTSRYRVPVPVPGRTLGSELWTLDRACQRQDACTSAAAPSPHLLKSPHLSPVHCGWRRRSSRAKSGLTGDLVDDAPNR